MESTPTNICCIALASAVDATRQEQTLQSIFIDHFGVIGFLLVLLCFAGLLIRHLLQRVAIKDEQIKVTEARIKLCEDEKEFSEQRRGAAEQELRAILSQQQTEKAPRDFRTSSCSEPLRHILLVEDEKAIHHYKPEIESALSRTEVRLANNGAEAWLRIRESTPCMIIMDLIMPVMDGYELLEKLAPKYSDVPILVVSGYVKNPEEIGLRVATNLPPFEFLPKPFVLADLITAIHKLTGNKLRRHEELLRVA